MSSGTEFEFIVIPNGVKGAYSAPFNIATEQYLLESCSSSFIHVWRNRSAVIVGVNQNTLSEVDLEYTESQDIEVVRRMSGGGAVYHDMGNICYTLIAPFQKDKDLYKEFCTPVIEYLNSLGVRAEFSGRNDITVGEYKISGNAQRVYRDRVMHHGTILFDTDLTVLEKALIPSPLKLKSKGIKSVRARVKNIRSLCDMDMSADEFYNGLRKRFESQYKIRVLSEEDISAIEKIAKEKYSTYEWNVGKSPVSQFKKSYKFPYGIVELGFDLENGVIKNPSLHGDFFELESIEALLHALDGVKPVKEELLSALSGIGEVIRGAEPEEFIDKLFFSGE